MGGSERFGRRGFLGAMAATAAGLLVPEWILDPPKGRSMVAVPPLAERVERATMRVAYEWSRDGKIWEEAAFPIDIGSPGEPRAVHVDIATPGPGFVRSARVEYELPGGHRLVSPGGDDVFPYQGKDLRLYMPHVQWWAP